MELLIFAIILGLGPAAIAKIKGRSFFVWWLYGAALFIIALPHSLLMNPNQEGIDKNQIESGMKKCPYCAEFVKAEAIVCRYCNRDLK